MTGRQNCSPSSAGRCRSPTEEVAAAAVFAYGCFNDITARRAQKLTTQWTIGKNVDSSGPVSELVTVDEAPDPASGLRITSRVNGELTQDAKTDQMIFPVPQLLAFLSRTFTLRPGDLVATGTPSGVGYAPYAGMAAARGGQRRGRDRGNRFGPFACVGPRTGHSEQ